MRQNKTGLVWRLALILLLAILPACKQAQPVPPTSTQAPSKPTPTRVPPTATFTTKPPTATKAPTKPPSTKIPPGPTFTSAPPATATKVPFSKAIWIYYIDLKTGGPDGCGDTATPISINHPRTGDVASDITLALQRLFSYKQLTWGELANPLGQENIIVDSVQWDAETKSLTVHLSGDYKVPKDKCDSSRIYAQVMKTIRQFPEVGRPIVYLNGTSFGNRTKGQQ